MSAAVTVLLAAVGAVAAILGVLLPVIVAQGKSLRREVDSVRTDVAALTARVDLVIRDVHSLGERVARIEGTLTGPWRPPANGKPAAPAPSGTKPPATEAPS